MTQAADRRPRLLRADGGQTSLRVLRQVLLADHRLLRATAGERAAPMHGGVKPGPLGAQEGDALRSACKETMAPTEVRSCQHFALRPTALLPALLLLLLLHTRAQRAH